MVRWERVRVRWGKVERMSRIKVMRGRVGWEDEECWGVGRGGDRKVSLEYI